MAGRHGVLPKSKAPLMLPVFYVDGNRDRDLIAIATSIFFNVSGIHRTMTGSRCFGAEISQPVMPMSASSGFPRGATVGQASQWAGPSAMYARL